MNRDERASAVLNWLRCLARCWLPVLLIGIFPGCPGAGSTGVGNTGGGNNGGSTSSTVIDGNRDPVSDTSGKISGEPNDTFSQAIIALFDSAGTARLQGTVAGEDDLDVFEMGPLASGDQVVVDAMAVDSSLDVSIAVFDDQQRLVTENDDREAFVLDSRITWITRHAGETYYLVVTRTSFNNESSTASARRTPTMETTRASLPNAFPATRVVRAST